MTDQLTILTETMERILNSVLSGGKTLAFIPAEKRAHYGKVAMECFANRARNGAEVSNAWHGVLYYMHASMHGLIDGPANFVWLMDEIVNEMACELRDANPSYEMLWGHTAAWMYAFDAQNEFNSYQPVNFERKCRKVHATRKCQGCWSHRRNRQAHVTVFIGDCFEQEAPKRRDYCYTCVEMLRMVDPRLIGFMNRLDNPNECGFLESR